MDVPAPSLVSEDEGEGDADGSAIGPATAVISSLTEPGHYTGFFPLMTQSEWERAAAVVRKLPELRNRVRQLESEQKAESKTEK